jgi:fatty-acyl-CoA synthase
MVDLNIPTSPAEDPASVYSLFAAAAARAPEATAITFLPAVESEPTRLTYRSFLSRLHRMARLFRQLGVARGDVVTLLAPSTPDAAIALCAAESVGIAHPVNTLLRAEEIAAVMRAAGSRVLVAIGPQADSDLWDKAVAAAGEVPSLRAIVALGATDPGAGYVHLDSRLPHADGPLDDPPAPGDIAAYFHTGGTSGAPKLARHTHAGQAFVVRACAAALGIEATTRLLNGMPLFHVAGAIASCIVPLAVGAEVILPTAAGFRDRAVIANHWRLVERLGATIIGGIPTSLVALLDVPTNGADLSSVKRCFSGGALVSADLANAFTERFAVPVHPVYGMTECSGFVTAADVATAPVPGTVGRPPPGVEIQVRQSLPDGAVGDGVAPGASGVIVVRGPNVFPGYLGDKPNPFTADGWLITGDLGSVGFDGLLRITGRAKDLIIRSGHNIDPAVIEDAAARHPQVISSAAVGKPDAYAGEIPTLYVVLRQHGPAIMDDLHAHMRRTVPEPPARPKSIIPLPALPMTAAGKVDKTALRRDAAARVAKDFLDASPAFHGMNADVTADHGPDGRMIVTIRLAAAGRAGKESAKIAALALSRFPFEHKLVFTTTDRDDAEPPRALVSHPRKRIVR